MSVFLLNRKLENMIHCADLSLFFKCWYRQIGTVSVSLTFYVMYIEQAVLVVTLAVLVANNGDYVLKTELNSSVIPA